MPERKIHGQIPSSAVKEDNNGTITIQAISLKTIITLDDSSYCSPEIIVFGTKNYL